MKKIFKITLWILAGLVFMATFVYLYLNSKEKEVEYEIEYPVKESIEKTSVLTGKIEPRDEIEIKPQISGIISEVLVEPGDHVTNGDIIAKIKVIPEESQLSAARNRVEVARIALREARQNLERTRLLYEKKYESREKYEADKAAYEKAEAELAQAGDQLTIVRTGVSADNEKGSNTLVRATVTGVVLEVPVKVGSSVIQANTFNDGTTIAKIADMTDLIFKGSVDETEVDLLHEGMKVGISIGAVQNRNFDAVIEKISPMATDNNGTNTFEVKAAMVLSGDIRLRAGYSANANVTMESVSNVLAVPESVVEYDGDKAYVYVLTDSVPHQKFERQEFKAGLSDGIMVEVKSGKITMKTPLRGKEVKSK